MNRAFRRLACLTCLACLACLARSSMGFQLAFARGQRDLSAGRLHEAALAFDQASRGTASARERREAGYLAAQSLRRAGELPEALRRMDDLARDPDSGRAARAALESARIRLGMGARAEALRGLDGLIHAWPATGPGRSALTLLLSELDRDDPTGGSCHRRLEDLARQLPLASMRDAVLYENARRYDAEGRPREAIVAWRRLLDEVPYPQNRHWDDGALRLAEALSVALDPAGAITVLDRALAVRERAYSSGSYEAPRFAECAMLRARLLRDPLGELEASAQAFHFVYASFATSRLRDDALWEEAEVRTRLGDRAAACEIFRRLAEEFPSTRRGRAAAQARGACAGLSPGLSPGS